MESIGERIKQIRQDRKLSQQEFAEKLSVSRSFISRVEHNKENPSETLLKLISWSFSCNLDWLTNGSGNKYSTYKENQLTYRNIVNSELLKEIDSTNDYRIKISLAKSIQCCSDILCKNNAMPLSKYYFAKKIEILFDRLSVLAKITPDISDDLIETSFDGLKSQVSSLLNDIEECFFEDELDNLLDEENQVE